MGELRHFNLPDVGEGLTEAEILTWRVRPGDTVAINQILIEIETAKAAVELPSPFAGRVAELLVAEGDTVPVGTPLIAVAVSVDSAEMDATSAGPATSVEPATAPVGLAASRASAPVGAVELAAADPAEDRAELVGAGSHRAPALVGYGFTPGGEAGPGEQRAHRPRPSVAPGGNAVQATPPARRLARDLGVDLGTVAGTGPAGAITRDDIRRAVAPGTPTRIPVRGVRRSTADAMTQVAATVPHVTTWVQTDVTATVEAVARLREMPEFQQRRVSPLLLVSRALLLAVERRPMINAWWDEPAREIVLRDHVHLGIAVATERGLLVPKVKDAHALRLPALAAAIENQVDTARAGRSTPSDLTGGTITITNTGVFGVDGGTPLTNVGESAILAVGQIRDMPWVHEGALAVRKVTTLALSFDHRVVDGDLASGVLRDVADLLADPVRMLARC
ncbi:dihydrolipoamide acetyltransferase family protein [Micromonospora profundi]|uniref:dihydrolipoamide acetyltransferase family protein n=1 Tax=Micromonospora profundi TaxID=1420889 RepID=UPI0033A06763